MNPNHFDCISIDDIFNMCSKPPSPKSPKPNAPVPLETNPELELPEVKFAKAEFLPTSLTFYQSRGKFDPFYAYVDGKIGAPPSEEIQLEGFVSQEASEVCLIIIFIYYFYLHH